MQFDVYYSGMDRKSMTESCEGKGNLCYEAGKSATCMAERLPHTLGKVREGLRAGEVVGEGRVEEGQIDVMEVAGPGPLVLRCSLFNHHLPSAKYMPFQHGSVL